MRKMASIDLLFRFRDLVAPTIRAHRNVIKEQGWCWWGWWKRPTEDSRRDIWSHIADETKGGRTTSIALFDSGSGDVYTATVAGVIPPDNSRSGQLGENTINVPINEIEHVPSYYRSNPFSRAWLKLTSISDKPIHFYRNYSFAETPQLPNYDASTLKRLKDKKIINADELRGMDTTIWRIRDARPDDSAEQILLSTKGINEPISFEAIRAKFDTILHLTDLHFADGSNRAQHVWRYPEDGTQTAHTLTEAIKAALGETKVGLLIISGDFAFIGSSAEFELANNSITLLMGALDLSDEQIIIVPGNHDIQWSTEESYNYNSPVRQAPPEARRNYETFYRKLLGHEPNRHLSMGRRYALPCGLVVEICGLNSSSLQTGREFLAGMGRIDEGGFADASGILNWRGKSTFALRILVLHHHLALTEDLELNDGFGKGFGLAVDAVRIQRLAAQKGVHLALHGHKHRSFIWRSTVYELPENARTEYRLGELSIVGGGSAGSVETEANSNYFNVISIKPSTVQLQIFQARNRGAFQVISEWQAALSLHEDGLKLHDWMKYSHA
jgi:hypothetical protein